MKYLKIYLQDHFAGATAGAELAKRAAKHNEGDAEFGGPLQRIAAEIDEDREQLRRIMAALEVEPDRIKTTLMWAGEKAGRLKPNGDLLRFSPLSRHVEIEGLITGVSGKLSLWRALIAVEAEHAQLDAAKLTEAADRAEDQLRRLHELREWTESGSMDLLPVRERIGAIAERDKLETNLGGVADMQRPPDAMFVVDLKTEAIGVREAAMVELLGQTGLPASGALAVSLPFFGVTAGLSLLGGLVYLISGRRRR